MKRATEMACLTLGLILPACGGEGDWNLTTWGEDYIESGIPSEVFSDGCSVTYSAFLVTFTQRQLLTADNDIAGELAGTQIYDMTLAGPVVMGTVPVAADHYDSVSVHVAPGSDAIPGNASQDQVNAMIDAGSSVAVNGTLTCGGTSKTFNWSFATSTNYLCEPEDLTIPRDGSDDTQITIHGDHLWYDGLENPDAQVKGQPIFDADNNNDGQITQAELELVGVASLGYDVGRYSDVTNLEQFVSFLTQTLGHVDGEGHCHTGE